MKDKLGQNCVKSQVKEFGICLVDKLSEAHWIKRKRKTVTDLLNMYFVLVTLLSIFYALFLVIM